MCSLIYYFVPKGHVPWHGVWPGALFVTITTGIANAVFPFYLGQISNVDQFGAALGFILVALFWFYLVSLALMAGAVNALRHELTDTEKIHRQRLGYISISPPPPLAPLRALVPALTPYTLPPRDRITSDSLLAWPSPR